MMQFLSSSMYFSTLIRKQAKHVTKLRKSLIGKENSSKTKSQRQKEGQGVKQEKTKPNQTKKPFKQAGIVATNWGLNQPIICLSTPSDGPELQKVVEGQRALQGNFFPPHQLIIGILPRSLGSFQKPHSVLGTGGT